MPIEKIPGTNTEYLLVAFDKQGRERTDDPDGRMSDRARQAVAQAPVTDVFLFSHGWKGDIPAARLQYENWIGNLIATGAGQARLRASRPAFQPLFIGLHWPSLPFGEEGFAPSFEVSGADPVPQWIEEYADRIADTPKARAALRVIFDAAIADSAPPELPPQVIEAYRTLDAESGLQAQGEAGGPGADRLAFDPETAYATAGGEVQFGGGFGAKLLVPLQQLSFWSMKDRARQVGESGLHDFVAALMNAVPPGRDVRFHLMGHSFGCIVMSSVATGRNAQGRLPKPLQSVVLVQGALSLWSYCTSIPSEPSKKGHFRALVEGNRVSGPVCLTTSEFDRAVGILYPAAAGVAKQVEFVPGELPKYGAVGTFGAQGPGVDAVEEAMHPLNQPYQFQPGAVYNFNSSQFICDGGGVSGAHSDISKPEVAQLIWSAAL